MLSLLSTTGKTVTAQLERSLRRFIACSEVPMYKIIDKLDCHTCMAFDFKATRTRLHKANTRAHCKELLSFNTASDYKAVAHTRLARICTHK